MAIFNSTSWTGRDVVDHGPRWTGGDVADAVTLPKPAVTSAKLEARQVQPSRDGYLAEYADLAQLVGVASPDLGIEAFKDFLRSKDWGIFSLAEVVKYMDKKAAAESKDKAGWEWRPLRETDQMLNAIFGMRAERRGDGFGHQTELIRPASDYYSGPREYMVDETILVHGSTQRTGKQVTAVGRSSQSTYDKTIPLHALRKIATTEREFKSGPVSFFVCDYALAPQIEHPDPFLMAAINNPKLAAGVGRFIIDFWDEPGFGLERSLK